MFASRKANNFINRTHERSVRIVSGDNEGNFENLLEKYKEITNSPHKFASIND